MPTNNATLKTMVFISFLLLGSQTGFAASQSFDEAFAQRIALFNYDDKAYFGVKDISTEKHGDVTVRDLTFTAIPGRDPIKAYLVVPKGNGPFAGILWMHWLGENNANRSQYLDEAVALADKGIESLLIDAMWSAPEWYSNRVPEQDYENSVRQIIEIRRAMDLLTSQKNVDKSRIGFVGHDYGGMYGAIAAGVEPRAITYVFIAVAPSLYNWAFFSKQPISKVDYVHQNAVLEITDYLGQIKNASVLGQFSKTDPYISRTDGFVFISGVASPTKERRLYEAGHDMVGEEIMRDRDEWLIRELSIKK